MIPSPIDADAHRCKTPKPPLINGTRIIPIPSTVTLPRSELGMALLRRSLIRSGGANEVIEMIRIVTSAMTISFL